MDKVVHFEIPADDLDRAQRFYRETFGWEIAKVPMPEAEYYIANTVPTDSQGLPKEPGAINGALMRRENSGQSPIIVISVSSVADYLEKAERGGGRVVLATQQVGDMGLYARICDTEGNCGRSLARSKIECDSHHGGIEKCPR
jgi:predicted enzyme related to lactoylglutathione lyase